MSDFKVIIPFMGTTKQTISASSHMVPQEATIESLEVFPLTNEIYKIIAPYLNNNPYFSYSNGKDPIDVMREIDVLVHKENYSNKLHRLVNEE